MPFKSETQRKWMWANKPELARKWTEKYGAVIIRKKAYEELKRQKNDR